MTHDESVNGNIMKMYHKIKSTRPNEICKFVTKKEMNQEKGYKRCINKLIFVCSSSFHLATSHVIFLDNVFLPMAFMRFRKKVRLVQLWHGCNTLKKFGQLSNTGQLKWLERRANSRYTHLITSSIKMSQLHQEAFGIEANKIYALGLPRMDIFFEKEEVLQEEKEIFYKEYPELKDKKIILYAPTFRDNDLNLQDTHLDLQEVACSIADDYVILTKFHPFVCGNHRRRAYSKLIDVSNYNDLNRLLFVADILITDYSSIIFEYALLNKPIIFYAYDQEIYAQKIRGFYYDYTEYVPGVIVQNKKELIKAIEMKTYLQYTYNDFVDGYLEYKDSQSTERIYNMVYR